MAITVSIVIAYPLHVDFLEEIRPEIEQILGTQIPGMPKTVTVGSTRSCIIDVELPDNFDIRGIRSQINDRLPDVNANVATRFRRSIWEWRGIDVVIAVTSGIAVALMLDAVRLLLARP